MSTNSIEAFNKPGNKVARWTHRRIISHFLMTSKERLTSREIAARTRLNHSQVHKRISELIDEGKIVVCGVKLEGKNHNGVYKFNPEPVLFPVRKITLRQWLKQNNPEILHKYEIIIEHKL